MRMCIAGTALVAVLALAGTTHAGPIGVQHPYFTYSPGAVDFEDIKWTSLDYAVFTAYGGYFANVRQPRAGTPIPLVFVQNADFGIEDEVNIQANVLNRLTLVTSFAPAAYSLVPQDDVYDAQKDEPSVPEPGAFAFALVGIGLLAVSRSLRRKLAR